MVNRQTRPLGFMRIRIKPDSSDAFAALLLFQSEIDVNRPGGGGDCLCLTPTFIPELFGAVIKRKGRLGLAHLITFGPMAFARVTVKFVPPTLIFACLTPLSCFLCIQI
jgi:hypothetical protein